MTSLYCLGLHLYLFKKYLKLMFKRVVILKSAKNITKKASNKNKMIVLVLFLPKKKLKIVKMK